jgi:transposase
MPEVRGIMYRVQLDDTQRQELSRRAHQAGVMPRTRDRLEMVRLSDAGWGIPRIARHFGLSEKCVRFWIKTFLSGGFEALPDKAHVGQSSALTPDLLAAIRAEVGKGQRTWTAQQISEWLSEQHGVRLGADWLARLLRRHRLSYQRTSRSLGHKQDAEEVAQKRASLQTLQKGAMPD